MSKKSLKNKNLRRLAELQKAASTNNTGYIQPVAKVSDSAGNTISKPLVHQELSEEFGHFKRDVLTIAIFTLVIVAAFVAITIADSKTGFLSNLANTLFKF